MTVPAAADADAAIQIKVNGQVITLPAGSLAHWSNITQTSPEFKTDTDISHTTHHANERELQAWKPDDESTTTTTGDAAAMVMPPSNARGDEATFGPGVNGGTNTWDQFEVNEKMFGVKTSFDEEVYTTKLDRTSADYKERERRAQAIANEIMSVRGGFSLFLSLLFFFYLNVWQSNTANPHIAEERNIVVDDSGANEEDKYAGVIRGPNAYVPPARRQPGGATATATKQPDTAPTSTATSPPTAGAAAATSSSTSTPTPSAANASGNATTGAKGTPDLTSSFREFVQGEKQRLTQKRQAIVKSEMDKRMSELVKFSQSFKVHPSHFLN